MGSHYTDEICFNQLISLSISLKCVKNVTTISNVYPVINSSNIGTFLNFECNLFYQLMLFF